MAYLEIVKVGNLFEFVLYSKYIPHSVIYEWLLDVHRNVFLELEIVRTVDRALIRRVKQKRRSLENNDEPIFADWITINIKSNCSKEDSIETLCDKLLYNSILKTLLLEQYRDQRRVVYKTCLSKDDENFRRIWTAVLKKFETKRLKKQYIKETFNAYERETGLVSFDYIKNLARQHNFLGCHWMMPYADSKFGREQFIFRSLDDYKKLLKSFFFGYLCMEINVVGIGTKKLSDGGVCLAVYHANFLKNDKPGGLFALDKAIRKSGVVKDMKLKLDIYSVCQIRKGNPYRLRPTIYSSRVNGRRSIIDPDYTENYRPDVSFGQNEVWFNRF